jgi:Putative MetA-pathway of phenol degradation
MKPALMPPSRGINRRLMLLVASLLMSFLAARADERLFTYVQEAEVLPKGGLEFEQWLTHRRGKADGVFARWDFREELEYGLTDRLTAAGYLNFKSTHSEGVSSENGDKSGIEFEGVSTELKYQLLNPNTKPIGLLLYGEATYNGEEFELEEKLVLQKNFGEKWVAAFNVTLEEEWAFTPTDTEEELALELTAGIAYKLTPHWALGLEGRNVRKFPDFDSEKSSAWFVGPALHYGSSKWWATLTVLPQVSGRPDTRSGLNLDEHERIEVRLIAGINF